MALVVAFNTGIAAHSQSPLKKDTNGFAFQVLSFGCVFFAPAKKMNPSDMTEDTTSIRATASFARKGAHELILRPYKKPDYSPRSPFGPTLRVVQRAMRFCPVCAGMTRRT